MKNKTNMKFIRTDSVEVAKKLRALSYTELPQIDSSTFCFMNDGIKLTFDAEKENCVYTNILHI